RAYDLAREGETFEIEPRPINVYRLELISAEPDAAVLVAECGKGTYVRAIARDLGRALGCYGYVSALRRTGVGPFQEADSVKLADLEAAAPAEGETGDRAPLMGLLQPVDAGLRSLPSL